MNEEEHRRCCLLGGCGCGSGGPAQRQALLEWITAKIQNCHLSTLMDNEEATLSLVSGWLDELPWKSETGDGDLTTGGITGEG